MLRIRIFKRVKLMEERLARQDEQAKKVRDMAKRVGHPSEARTKPEGW